MFQKGEKNPNYRGGVAKYPNHSVLKKNRLVVLKKAKGKCEICHRRAKTVHHVDGSVDNHTIRNLVALCLICHKAVHHEEIYQGRATSKYIRLYGLTITKMVQKYGGSTAYFSKLHKEGKLKQKIDRLKAEREK